VKRSDQRRDRVATVEFDPVPLAKDPLKKLKPAK